MVTLKQALVVGSALVLLASCSGDDDSGADETTTTTVAATITSITSAADGTEPATTDTSTTTTTTTSEAPELSFPEYKIISRESSDDGDVVVVLLDPDTYESLSDIDIHDVIVDLVEQYAPVFTAHVVETQAAVDALFVENPTEEQQTALDTGYIARLEEGFRIVYVGRFEEIGSAILGS